MTTTYGPVGAFGPTATTATPGSSATGSSATASTKDRNAVDTDMFLKLLVAQLKYQDPNNATDPSEFLSQSAQFSTVEKLAALEKLTQKAYDSSRQQTAASMVGRTVTWTDATGTPQTGVVSSVSVGATTPNLTVGTLTVSLDDVTSVRPTPATTGSTIPGS
jgi:flagellar basal-body rod modification protein FlgD